MNAEDETTCYTRVVEDWDTVVQAARHLAAARADLCMTVAWGAIICGKPVLVAELSRDQVAALQRAGFDVAAWRETKAESTARGDE